jgi:glucose-6-phosphate-specific signal transduction histidine kinase
MRERIAAVGGSIQRDGESGMRVRVTLPTEANLASTAPATVPGNNS